jgi:signal transduction histidine kinase
LSQALHPSILEELGLDSAVESYLSNVERQLGLHVTYERTGPPLVIPPAVSIQVYRVLQEALTNVARHSGASEALVHLTSAPGWLELVVEDQGRGLDHDEAALVRDTRPTRESRPTTGLTGMRERAALVGGTLDVDSSVSGGTRVRLRVPIGPTDGTETGETERTEATGSHGATG